jgi:hypothetical protein
VKLKNYFYAIFCFSLLALPLHGSLDQSPSQYDHEKEHKHYCYRFICKPFVIQCTINALIPPAYIALQKALDRRCLHPIELAALIGIGTVMSAACEYREFGKLTKNRCVVFGHLPLGLFVLCNVKNSVIRMIGKK